MRLFLKNDSDGEKCQTALNIVVLYAVKKNLVSEAEAAVAAYMRHKPQNIEDHYRNDLNYGVFSIPMSFLIDRRGVLLFISMGAGEAEITALGKMIKKLMEEPLDGKSDAGTKEGPKAMKSAVKGQ